MSDHIIKSSEMHNVDVGTVEAIGRIVRDSRKPMKQRFRALFTLRNLGGKDAVNQITSVFTDSSALLKHECAYCLGQMQDSYAVPALIKLLEDPNQESIVRHEAGEALGAIGDTSALPILEKYCKDSIEEVSQTCHLAVNRIKWLNQSSKEENLLENPYKSVDPAPPASTVDVDSLKKKLLDEKLDLFERYRAMFTLRNIGGEEAALALAEGLHCKGALLRHEVAFVLGQMAEPATAKHLIQNLQDLNESSMVRHECAEALGSIATDECIDILEKYRLDTEKVVEESCEVALDMCEYQTADQFQYADGLTQITNV